MNKRMILLGVLLLLMIVCMSIFASAKTLKDYPEKITLDVEFEDIVKCSTNTNKENVIKIEVEGEEFVTYTIKCNNSIVEAKYPNDIVDYDGNDQDDANAAFDSGDIDRIDFELEFDLDIDEDEFCSGSGLYDLCSDLSGNLSFCYNTMQTLVGLEATCIDNAEFAGEYRSKYESCTSDYDECSTSLTSISDERQGLDDEATGCQSDLDNCNDNYGECNRVKAECNVDKDEFEKKAGQNIMYGIGGLILGLIGMNFYNKGKGGSPGRSAEEKELYDEYE